MPRELGGGGLTFAQVMQEQRRLAYYAHATALAINMHLYWTGVAADLWRAGDKSLEWLLDGAVKGEVYAAGHAERGNDIPVLLSTTKAERVDGGYRFTGHKFFGSLTPVWTYLGLHGMDTSDPAAPKIVHAFMPRATEGYSIQETWDMLGMRATASHDTILEGAFVPGPVHRPRGARRVRGRRPLRPGRLPVGADRLRQRLLRPGPAPARPDRGERQEEDVAGHLARAR